MAEHCFWPITSIQIIWLQQHHQEARCLELSVAEDYKLIITEFQDGIYEATLTRRDDSQNYVYGITRYAIVDQYMLGETPYYWFCLTLKDRSLDTILTDGWSLNKP